MKQGSNAQDRRTFLKTGGAVAAGMLIPAGSAAAITGPAKPYVLPFNPKTHDAMPTRNLGRTGFKVGLFSLGGQAALEKGNNFDVAVPILERALDLVDALESLC